MGNPGWLRFLLAATAVVALLADQYSVASAQSRPWHRPARESVAKGPAEAVKEAVAAVKRKDLAALVRLMPPRWTREAEELVRERVRRMDREAFSRLSAALGRLAAAAGKREEDLRKSFAGGGFYSEAEVLEMVRTAVKLWKSLDLAGLSRQDGWEEFRLERFAAGPGPLVLDLLLQIIGREQRSGVEAALALLGGATVDILRTERNEQFGEVVHIVVHLGDERNEDELVQVDGRWVTRQMAEDWESFVAESRQGHEEFGRKQRESREERLAKIRKLEAAVETFEKSGEIGPLLALVTGQDKGEVPRPATVPESRPPRELPPDERPRL